jgi:hypothetical protein
MSTPVGQPTPNIVYDGRHSAECKMACSDGECRHPRTMEGCGGCCGCLGGCRLGMEEQEIEAQGFGGGVA